MPNKTTAWLRLLRLPNLFTVPGDPLAGAILAAATLGALPHWSAVAVAVGVSLVLYMAGLIDNDLADLKEDRRDRPHRPLPSGQVRVPHAMIAAAALLLGAVLLAGRVNRECLAVAAALAATILLYNHLLKRVPVVGPLAMGLCRGLSVMVGASVMGLAGLGANPALAGGLIAVYIAAVTAIAAGETTGKPVGRKRNLPATMLAFFFTLGAMGVYGSPAMSVPETTAMVSFGIYIAFALLAVLVAAVAAVRLGGKPEPRMVQKTIGLYIRNLLPIQAAFCALLPSYGWVIAGALVAMFPLAGLVGRKFYAS